MVRLNQKPKLLFSFVHIILFILLMASATKRKCNTANPLPCSLFHPTKHGRKLR